MGDSLHPKRNAAICSLPITSSYGTFTFAIRASPARLKLNFPLVVVLIIAPPTALVGEMYVVSKN